jgi:hypothetical protein
LGQRVHHGAANGGGEHRRRHPGLRRGVLADQTPVEPVHHPPEMLVGGEDAVQDGIAGQGALHAAALEGQVDHAGEQRRARLLRAGLGRGVEHGFHPRELVVGDGDDDLVLGLELMVDGGLGYADGVRDHLQRRAADAVLGEQPGRGADDARLGRADRDGSLADGCA